MLITMAASYFEKRRIDGDGAVDLRRYLEANSVFFGLLWDRRRIHRLLLELVQLLVPQQRGRRSVLGCPGGCHAHLDGSHWLPAVAERRGIALSDWVKRV